MKLRKNLLVWLLRILALAMLIALPVLPMLAKFQLGPAAARCFAHPALDAFLVVIAWVLFTFVLGRFYCKFACPLGILQDLLGWLSFRPSRPQPTHPRIRWGIAALVWGALIGGWSLFFGVLDPFSLFTRGCLVWRTGRFGGQAIAISAVVLVLFYALCFWRKRYYCTNICPVGTILGGLARFSRFGIHFLPDQCVHCGKCMRTCPTGCIDAAEGSLDNSRCIRCLQCIAACPRDALRFGRLPISVAGTAAINLERRHAVIGGSLAALGVLLGWACHPLPRTTTATESAKPEDGTQPPPPPPELPILPPGGGSTARMASRCTDCLLCVQHCMGKVLQPPTPEIPYVHLMYRKPDHSQNGMCEFGCHRCSNLCPTGALIPLTLEAKRRTRIGIAHFAPENCIAMQDHQPCGACAEHCPTGAIEMIEDDFGVPTPHFHTEICIGCGSCEYACPVPTIHVQGVPLQMQAADPASIKPATPPAAAPAPDNNWPI